MSVVSFAYYPGCSAKGSSADYERSTRTVCGLLDICLEELPGWNCCGSTPAHAVDTELSAALCVRNLDIAAQCGAKTVLTPCPSCLSNLRHAGRRMATPEFRARVNELLDAPAAETLPEVTSVMQGIARQYDKAALTARVKKPLTGLRLGAYYGCLMSRPADLMDFGDPENPTLMEEMLTACGAEVVDFPLKTSCCGASFGIPERPMTARNSAKILELAVNMGLDALVVACPLCQMNLDLRQKQAAKSAGTTFDLPVPYFTQLLGLALGAPTDQLGLDKLCVSLDGLLKKAEGGQQCG